MGIKCLFHDSQYWRKCWPVNCLLALQKVAVFIIMPNAIIIIIIVFISSISVWHNRKILYMLQNKIVFIVYGQALETRLI